MKDDEVRVRRVTSKVKWILQENKRSRDESVEKREDII